MAVKNIMNDTLSFESMNLFKKLKPFQDLKSEPEFRYYILFSKWLKDADILLANDEFVQVHIVDLLSKINELAKKNYLKKMVFDCLESKENEHFIQNILDRCRFAFPHLRSHDFTKLLGSLIHIGFNPSDDDPEFMREWFLYSQKHIKGCSAEDMYKSLNEFSIMQICPPEEWMYYWFKHSQKCGWHTKLHKHVQLLRHLQSLNIDIDESWLVSWVNAAIPLLDKIKIEQSGIFDVYHLSDIIVYPAVYNNAEFMSVWFKKVKSALYHLDIDDKKAKHIFYQILKINPQMPSSLVKAFAKRFCLKFKFLECTEITRMLYSMACLHVDVDDVRLFLENCRDYFSKKSVLVFKEHQSKNFRNALVAQQYFSTKGFDLNIDYSKFENIINILKNKEYKNNEFRELISMYLMEKFSLAVEKNFWLDCITNTVDLYVPSKKLCIDLANEHYYEDTEFKRNIKLKHHLLNDSNFVIIIFDMCGHENDWKRYVDSNIGLYL